MLTVAKKGEMRGLKRKEETVDQSSVKAPRPRPFMPEPSCCAVTDLEKTQHTHEMDVSAGKR
ncbi:unnamed protein product [Urochloa decumbens]|uniref:Uncharacterized protein n=1 Tax=Urochloa decumbens TaxID=240449 RepID=A0ABC9EA15_9POAL